MTAETKAPLPQDVEKAFECLLTCGQFSINFANALDKIRAHIAVLQSEIALTTVKYAAYRKGAEQVARQKADEIEALSSACEWVQAHYANQDMSHVDFRVNAFAVCTTALTQTTTSEECSR